MRFTTLEKTRKRLEEIKTDSYRSRDSEHRWWREDRPGEQSVQKGGQPFQARLGEVRSPVPSCTRASGPLWPRGGVQHLLLSNTGVSVSLWVAVGADRRKSCVSRETECWLGTVLLPPLCVVQVYHSTGSSSSWAGRSVTPPRGSRAALAAIVCPQSFSRKAFSPRDLKECHQYPCLQVWLGLGSYLPSILLFLWKCFSSFWHEWYNQFKLEAPWIYVQHE